VADVDHRDNVDVVPKVVFRDEHGDDLGVARLDQDVTGVAFEARQKRVDR
jgi:hypothetical protein